MDKLLKHLREDFPHLKFTAGRAFCWSPQNNTICYKNIAGPIATWSLLHEVGHAKLGHTSYQSDFELIKLEAAAWQQAEKLAEKYGMRIDGDHVQDCLDTYRDWLHRRSTCPTCGTRSLQKNSEIYQCFNCQAEWKVTASRFCRPYRRVASNELQAAKKTQATFH